MAFQPLTGSSQQNNNQESAQGNGGFQPLTTGPINRSFAPVAQAQPTQPAVKQQPQQAFNPVQAVGNIWNAVETGYGNFFNSQPVKSVESTVSKAFSPVTNAIGGAVSKVVNTPLGKNGQSLAATYSQAMSDLGGGSVSYAPAKNNQANNMKELTIQQSQENQTDPVRRYGQDVVDALLSTMQGTTGGIFKNPTKSINPEEHIIKPLFQTAGQIYTLDTLGNVIGGILGKTPLATAVANNSKLAFLPKLISNIGSFDAYGQLDPDVKDRVKQFVSDTQQGTLMTTLSAVGKVKYSVPLAFGGFFGLAKLNGASNKDALVSGIIGAALDGADKIPGFIAGKFTSDFKNGTKEFTPQEAREFVVNSPFKDTPLGQDMMKQSFAAEEQGKNVQVDLGASKQGVLAKLFGKDKALSGNTPEGIGYNVNIVDPTVKTEGLPQGETKPVQETQGTQGKETAITEESPKESPANATSEETQQAKSLIRIPKEFNSPLDEKSTQQLASNPIAMRDAYVAKFGNEVNTDLAREMFTGYQGHNANQVQNASAGLSRIVLNHLLDTKQGQGNNTVLITGGGPGSGKTNSIADKLPSRENYPIVYDTTVSYKRDAKYVEQALKKGYDVQFAYILRHPLPAWESVLTRDRAVTENYHLDSHFKAQQQMIQLHDKYKDNPKVHFILVDNTGAKGQAKEMSVDELRNFTYNKEDVRRQIYESTEKAKQSGQLKKQFDKNAEAYYKGFTSDRNSRSINTESQPQRTQKPLKEENLQSANTEQTNRTVGNGGQLKYKSTQLDLPQEEAKKITDFSKIIPQDKLSPEEKTIEPHTTVLFGMDNEVAALHIEPIIKNIPPVTVELGKTSLFKNDKYDVLKVDVKSPELTALNEKLAKNFSTPGQTFKDYKPHVTIAYLKKGEGDLYSGLSLFEGKKITINHLTLSDGNGGREKIPLSGIGENHENSEAKTANGLHENGRGEQVGESRVGEGTQAQPNALPEKNNNATGIENTNKKIGESGGEKNLIPEENNHTSITLNAGINPGLDKFFNEDIAPAAITLGQAGKESFDVVNPPLATEAARKSADMVRKALSTIDNFRGITQGKYQKYFSFFNNHSDKQNVENTSAYERSRKFKTEPAARKGDPDYSTLYHDSMIESYKTIAAAYGKDEEGFIENYVRREFSFPNETEAKKGIAVLTNFARSLSGNKSVLKKRVLEMPLDEALQNMKDRKINVKMASTNPEELRQWSLINAKKLVVFRDMWNQLKAGKLVVFVRRSANNPDGMIKLDDRAAKVFAPAEVFIGDSEKGFKTIFETGSYYADPSVARILNNAISSGAEGSKLFRAARVIENGMGSMQLGLSAFHFTGTGINAGVSDITLGLRNVLNGKPIDAAVQIARGVIPGASLVRDVYLGTKLLNGLKENNPEAYTVLEKYFNPAGGRLARDQRYELGAVKGMYRAFQNGNIIGAGIRIPHALVDVFSYHLMTKIIPRAKATAFLDLAKNLDNRLPIDATSEQRQRAYVQAWASIDNRFGQLVYDNLFWNKIGKDIALLVTRSVGWNLGTIRELGGGILIDPFKTTVAGKERVSKKISERVTDRSLYAVALIAGVALMSAMYQYLHTGQGPQELKDYFFPKDGGKDRNGNPTRKSLPSYVKDLYAYSQDWKGTILHKSSPLIDLLTQFITNQDYQGNLITNKNDPIGTQLAQAGSHLLGTLFPFSVQQFFQGLQQGANPEQLAESFFGFVRAPAGVIKSDQQKALEQSYQNKFGSRGPQTPEQVQAQNLKNKARDEIAKDGWKNSKAFHELMKNGTLKTQAQRVAFIKSAHLTSQQRMIQRFPKAERAQFQTK